MNNRLPYNVMANSDAVGEKSKVHKAAGFCRQLGGLISTASISDGRLGQHHVYYQQPETEAELRAILAYNSHCPDYGNFRNGSSQSFRPQHH